MDPSVANRIEEVCGDLLRHYGYACAQQRPHAVALSRHVHRLRFLQQLAGQTRALVDSADAGDDASVTATGFISTLSATTLSYAGLPDHELRQLQATIREFLGCLAESADAQFAQVFAMDSGGGRQAMRLSHVRRALSRRLQKLFGAWS